MPEFEPYYADESEIPDDQKDSYEARQIAGSTLHVLKVKEKEGWALENVAGLRSANTKLRGDVDTLTGEHNTLKGRVGELDIDAAKQALTDVAQLRIQLSKAPTDEKMASALDAKEQEWKTKYETDVNALKTENAALDGQVSQLLRADVLTKEILEQGGDVEALLPHAFGRTRMAKQTDGTRVLQVVDTQGALVHTKKPGVTAPMDAKELVEDLAHRFPKLFDGSPAKGSGKTGDEDTEPEAGGGGKPVAVSDDTIAASSTALEDIVSGKIVRRK